MQALELAVEYWRVEGRLRLLHLHVWVGIGVGLLVGSVDGFAGNLVVSAVISLCLHSIILLVFLTFLETSDITLDSSLTCQSSRTSVLLIFHIPEDCRLPACHTDSSFETFSPSIWLSPQGLVSTPRATLIDGHQFSLESS